MFLFGIETVAAIADSLSILCCLSKYYVTSYYELPKFTACEDDVPHKKLSAIVCATHQKSIVIINPRRRPDDFKRIWRDLVTADARKHDK